MAHFVLRMRRDLSGVIAAPQWPPGVECHTLPLKPDRKLLKAAHAVLEGGYWQGGGGAPAFPQWWKALRRDKEFDPALVFLSMEGGNVLGMAQCWTGSFVKDLAVHPAARRRGLGRNLMLTAFDAFSQRGAHHVDLKVREENAVAIALYRSIGMTEIAREPG